MEWNEVYLNHSDGIEEREKRGLTHFKVRRESQLAGNKHVGGGKEVAGGAGEVAEDRSVDGSSGSAGGKGGAGAVDKGFPAG